MPRVLVRALAVIIVLVLVFLGWTVSMVAWGFGFSDRHPTPGSATTIAFLYYGAPIIGLGLGVLIARRLWNLGTE